MDQHYPFEPGPTLVKDAWYVIAWSRDITRSPISRTVLGQDVVLYRTEDGKAVALGDRCPHRGYRLSKSRLVGDAIACGYHGFTFDPAGTCVAIPSQEHIPAGFRTRRYPLAERWQWVWIWMGATDEADTALIPDHHMAGLTVDGWLAVPGCDVVVQARYQLFNENLLDLTHLSFLHPETIGSPEIAKSKVRIEVSSPIVRVVRDTLDEDATPPYAKRLGIAGGLIDRHHETTFIAPSFHIIDVTIRQAASTAHGTAPATYGRHKTIHAITPETATTMRDFWAFTRTYNQSEDVTKYLRDAISGVIQQDIDALETIEGLLREGFGPADYNCAADEASLKGRRVVQAMLREHGERSAWPQRRASA